ncbi:MAG: hypothetical protein HKN87_18905 [Saprospiraceae bacterium]|nr:hypothetical protein [Saprospiraceae bacterium]
MGELDLLAEMLVKIRSHPDGSEAENFASLIRRQAKSNVTRTVKGADISETHQWKRKKSLQALAILEGRAEHSLVLPSLAHEK